MNTPLRRRRRRLSSGQSRALPRGSLFTTAKKFKGLESRFVIVVDIDEFCFNDECKKRDFYVACSRATQYLCLIVDGDDEKLKNIAEMIKGPNFAPKGKIAMKTQAEVLRLD